MIDFHAHLDLYPDPTAMARECAVRNIYVLSVTTTPSAWPGTSLLAKGCPRIRTALGLHPQIAHERKGELALFERLLPEARYVGEIGLDGSRELRPHQADQEFVFRSILGLCARAGGRVMSIHSRRAASRVLDELEAKPSAGTPILHWFSGTHKEFERAVSLGCWFSVGPAMLSGARGRALTAKMPRDRILTETDGPFTRLEGRSTMPWDVDRAIKTLSELWSEPIEAVQKRILNNVRRLCS